MKKYSLLTIFAALILLSGCVKDEQPAPLPPPEKDFTPIKINELITKDTANPYFVDESGSNADWIELYNSGTKAIDIAGMWVTDKPGTDAEYRQIPEGNPGVTTIGPKGFLVLICGAKDANGDDIPTSIADGKVFLDFGLSSSKDSLVAIYNPDKAEIDISGDFNGLEDDKSFGRTIDGGDEWGTLASKTPGAPNDGSAPEVGTLVINEFMASNDSWSIPGEDPSATFPDWIEIYNTGDVPIDMGGWYVTDDLADSVQYQLPTDDPELTTVPAKGFLIIMCDGIGEGLHTNFKLSGGGEAVGIWQEGTEFTEKYEYCDTGCEVPNPGTDNSAGRDGDGSFAWIVFEMGSDREPSPGAPNN